MQGMIVESVWMLGIIAFMIILGGIAVVGTLRKRRKFGETAPSDYDAFRHNSKKQ